MAKFFLVSLSTRRAW